MFKTTDAGQTWAQIPSTAGAAWNSVCRLAIDQNNASIMLAGTKSGLYRSTDGGTTWSLRSAGKTFDVEFDPNDSSKCVAGRSDGRAQYSTDGGVTWSNALPNPFNNATRIELTYASGSPNMVYAAVNARGALGVYRSLDGGQTYAFRSSSIVSVLSNYTSAIWVDPTNVNRVVVGGLDLYRSTNGGSSFSRISRWSSYPNSAHADHHMIVEHPQFGSSNRTVFTGNDGGIQRTNNIDTVQQTSGWTNLNNDLAITQFYGGCINPTSGVVLGGAQDNGTDRGVVGANINSWFSPLGGDGSFCAADPTDPNVFYMQFQFIGLRRSTNGALTSGSSISNGINESDPNFMAYITLDPNDADRLYVCGERLWRANDASTGSPPNWVAVKPSLGCPSNPEPPPAHFVDNPPCNISTVAIADGNPNLVWAGHNNGHVYFSTNALSGSPTWTRVDTNPTALPNRWVSRIVIDKFDHNKVTVSFMGFAPTNVWRTTDSGSTWAPCSGSGPGALPEVPVSCILQHRVAKDAYYAATDLGLFYSEDDCATWTPAVGGPTIVPMDEIFWRNNKTLVVATHGRSMWSCEVSPASLSETGVGCGVTTPPTLTATLPILGDTQVYTMASATANAPAALGISGGPPNPVPVGPCTLYPNLTGLIMLPSGNTDGAGSLIKNLPIPPFTSLLGGELTAQMFTATAGGPFLGVGETSSAVTMIFGL